MRVREVFRAAHYRMVAAAMKSRPKRSPLISVVIPCYNGASFLADAVDSVVRQTYRNTEVIIVDDGSTDDSVQVAHRLIDRNPAVRMNCLTQANAGVSAARNAGIARSSGDFILALDCDDVAKPSYLERVVMCLSWKPALNLVCSNLQYFGAEDGVWMPRGFSRTKMLKRNVFSSQSVFSKELWQQVGGFDPSHPWGLEDWHFWSKCMQVGLNPYRIPEALVYYRKHASTSRDMEFKRRKVESLSMHKTMLPNLYPVAEVLGAHRDLEEISQESLDRIAAIREKHPDRPYPWFWLSLSQEGRGAPAAAAENYRKAAERADEDDWQPLHRLESVTRRAGRTREADELRARVLKIKPQAVV